MRDEQNFLEYHPHLQYVKDRTPEALPTVAADGLPLTAPRPAVDPALDALKGNTSAQVMQQLDDALAGVRDLVGKIAARLSGDVKDGISFEAYFKARARARVALLQTDPLAGDTSVTSTLPVNTPPVTTPPTDTVPPDDSTLGEIPPDDPSDADITAAYEQAHQGSITGSTEMDVLPAVLSVADELEGLKGLMQDRFYGGESPRNLDVAIQQEKDAANGLIEQAQQEQLTQQTSSAVPIDQIRMDNTFRDVISDRVSIATGFIAEAGGAIDEDLNHDTDGQLDALTQGIDNLPDLDLLSEINQDNFDTDQTNFEADNIDDARLDDTDQSLAVFAMLSTVQGKAMRVKPIIDQLALETSPAMQFLIEEQTQALCDIHQDVESVTLDVYRMSLLKKQKNSKKLSGVKSKRKKRQLHKLIDHVARHGTKARTSPKAK